MKKFLCLSWLLMQLPFVSQNEIMINEQQITIVSNESMEGFLFRDDKLIREIKKEDYSNNEIMIDVIEPGIYTFYDKEGKCVDREVYLDDNIHIAFDYMVRSVKDGHYLFQEKPKMMIISSEIDERYPYEEKDGYYLYEFDEEKIEFLNQTYFIHVDHTVPNVSIDQMNEIEAQVYITNQSTIHLQYEDTYPEMFEYLSTSENVIQLHEGINDISCYFMDEAQNKLYEKVWVIYDQKAPVINENENLYINSPKTISINDSYLDLQHSYVIKNGEEKIELKTNEFVVDESGQYEFRLADLAGNNSVYCLNVHYDQILPSLITRLNQQNLSIQYTEELRAHNLMLTHNGEALEITDGQVTLEDEGFYYLQGTLVDLAGNSNTIYEEIRVDYQKPKIEVNLDQEIYLSVPRLDYIIEDLFEIKWKIDIHQNNEHLKTLEGIGNVFDNDVLSKLNLNDYNGNFTIKFYVSDGIYENEVIKSFQIDTRCEPIELKINGYLANQVEEIMVNNDVILEAYCSEGEVYYKLFKNGEILKEDVMKSLMITNNDDYSKVEFSSFDDYGHKTTKTIYFDYPRKVELFSTGKKTIDDELKDGLNEEIIYNEDLILKTPEVDEDQSKENFSVYLMVGGAVSVLVIIRIFLYAKNRFRKDKANLFKDETILLENSEETQCLSDSTN